MARVEFLIGGEGPFFIDDTSPLWNDPRQVAQKGNSIAKVDIVDNLNSTSSTKPLSAKQGTILKGMIAAVEAAIPEIPEYIPTTLDPVFSNPESVLAGNPVATTAIDAVFYNPESKLPGA